MSSNTEQRRLWLNLVVTATDALVVQDKLDKKRGRDRRLYEKMKDAQSKAQQALADYKRFLETK